VRKFSSIVGWHILFVFLSPLFLISLVTSAPMGLEFSSYCAAQSPCGEVVEGRVESVTRLSKHGRPGLLIHKVGYEDEQGCRQFFYALGEDLADKKAGDSVSFKIHDGKVVVAGLSDVLMFLVASAITLLLFSAEVVAGLMLRNYQNEVRRGKEGVILLVIRLLMLCASSLAFCLAVVWIRDDFLPKEVESAQILSINLGRKGCVLTVKTLDGREESLTTLTLPPVPILSTGQNVEVLFPKDGKPRLPTRETSVVFFAGSFYLLFVSVSAFFRRRKSYKISVPPEDNVELPPFEPFKG
jgi:hypothetical protein